MLYIEGMKKRVTLEANNRLIPIIEWGCVAACALFLLAGGCTTPGPVDPPLSQEQWTPLDSRALLPSQFGIELKKRSRTENVEIKGILKVPLGAKHFLHFAWKSHKGNEYPAISHKVNGKRLQGLLATSLAISLVDYKAGQHAGVRTVREEEGAELLRTNITTPDGRLPFYPALAKTASFRDKVIYKVPFGILDRKEGFEALDWLQGLAAETLIGTDLLRAYDRASLDLEKGLVTLSSGAHKTNIDNLVAAAPLIGNYVTPVIEILVDGKGPVPVALATSLDTGLRLPSSIAAKLDVPGAVFATMSEELNVIPAGYAPVDIAGVEFGETPVQIVGYPAYREEPPYAFLGSRFLRDYIVTLDFGTKKVYFEKR